MTLLVRDTAEPDLQAVTAIYAHHVRHGTGIFEEHAPDAAEMGARIKRVVGEGGAWLVAESDAALLGFGFFRRYRDTPAFRFAAEDQIYVRDDVRGMGVGRAIGEALVERATGQGYRQMLAVIGDSENVGSIGLHAALGFRQAGVLKAIGLKFGRWVDAVTMQRALGEGERTIPG
jgi:phosphinothricin acetyltransferase